MTGSADWRNWALLGFLGVMWGGSFTTTGFAVATLPPLTVAAGRLVVGALALIVAAYAMGRGLPSVSDARGRRVWASAIAIALITNSIPFSLLAWAQQHIASGIAGVFMGALPLIVLPMAHVFAPGEQMTARKMLGFVIGFAGVMTLFGGDVLSNLGGAGLELLAQLACLGAATCYAVGSIVAKRSEPAHPVSFAAAAVGVAALIMTPVALILEQPWTAPWTPASAGAVIALGLFPTGLAMVVLYLVIQSAGPSFFSMVNYQVPVWAMIFGALILGEAIPLRAALALALILLGVAISQNLIGARARAVTPPPG